MKVYWEEEEYEWPLGSKDLKTQLQFVNYNRLIYLVGENGSIMVNLREIHFNHHEKEKEPV